MFNLRSDDRKLIISTDLCPAYELDRICKIFSENSASEEINENFRYLSPGLLEYIQQRERDKFLLLPWYETIGLVMLVIIYSLDN